MFNQQHNCKMDYDNNTHYERLCRAIESSTNLLQLETTEKMLDLFRNKEQQHPEWHEKLQMLFARKAAHLHYFEWKYFKDFDADAA